MGLVGLTVDFYCYQEFHRVSHELLGLITN